MRPLAILGILVVPALHVASGTCLEVQGDKIVAGDLASVFPAFGSVSPEEPIALAPLPGARRFFGPAELVRIGKRLGLDIGPAAEICFEYPAAPLTAAQIMEALKLAVNEPNVVISLLDFSHYPVPKGELVFQRSGLYISSRLTAESIVLWRGKLTYSGKSSVQAWARVKLSVNRKQLVAAKPFPSGGVIDPASVSEQEGPAFPFLPEPPLEAAGLGMLVARRPIPIGKILSREDFAPKPEVTTKSEVEVRVTSANSELKLSGTAQTSGAVGDTVLVKNPLNGRTFRAVVAGKGQVTVHANP